MPRIAANHGLADGFAPVCRRLGPRLMRDLGLTDVQAAGLLGNLGHESGGFRVLQEIRPAVEGSRGGWGLAQWTGHRRLAMEAWCRSRALDPASLEANYGYLCAELRSSEAPALAALRAAATLEAATETVCRSYERPGIVALSRRLDWARRALAALRDAPVGPTRPSGPDRAPRGSRAGRVRRASTDGDRP